MTTEQKIRQTISNTAKKVTNEFGINSNIEYSADALNLIGEFVVNQLGMYANDLETFQRHAKRTQITVDDVKLLVRRNDSLKEFVDEKIKVISKNKPAEAPTTSKRKRKPTDSTS
ncbi:centromere protein S-like [Sitophilus oryzae]|uniref:Centromere protein S n=1 Tax=Sitophilus oryzae TaxID=7048 RepID=A0A6J2XQ93_SITOR|nr:centromere protein S-like [Sitophilus oryzae]